VEAHTCNLSYLGGGDGEDRSSKPTPGKRLARPHLNKKTRDLAYIYSLSYKGAVGRKRSKAEWEKEKKKKERETLCEK
jgi:hypothetical protein